MPKAKVRDGKLTIPLSDKIREKLDFRDGDKVEVRIAEGAVILQPAAAGTREGAWERIFSIIDHVQLRPGQPEMAAEQVEQMIVNEVNAVRRAQHDRQRDG